MHVILSLTEIKFVDECIIDSRKIVSGNRSVGCLVIILSFTLLNRPGGPLRCQSFNFPLGSAIRRFTGKKVPDTIV